MTEVQREIFGRVNELLKEHFEGSVVCVVDEGEDLGKLTSLQYNGGLLQAIGMVRVAEMKMLVHQVESLEFRSEEKEE